jgi:hypothetical protein
MQKMRLLLKKPDIPVLIILAAGLLTGLLIFDDFGASWDEPEYYEYADSTIGAYSISARLNGTYQYSSVLGKKDLRYYGPAFLIVGKGMQALLKLVFPHALSIDLWHLTIYFSYLLSVFFFYKLAQRWVSTRAAVLAALLFAGQPVLFGSAWINPKDIPFMVFFLGAVYFGLAFLDHGKKAFANHVCPEKAAGAAPAPRRGIKTKTQKTVLIISLILLLLSSFLILGGDLIRSSLEERILSVNIHSPARLIDWLFVQVASNAQNLPLQNYANKAVTIFNRLTGGIAAAAFLGVMLSIGLLLDSRLIKKSLSLITTAFDDIRRYPNKPALIGCFFAACLFLGFACATRVVGGLAALLVIWVWMAGLKKKSIPLIGLYGLLSLAIFFICWPYIWRDTLSNLLYVLNRMTSFPDDHANLLAGVLLNSKDLPASYLPSLLARTISETGILLFLAGIIPCIIRLTRRASARSELVMILAWFFLPFFYVVLTTPPMYDNYRHFLFILPAAFLLAAFAVDWLFQKLNKPLYQLLLSLVILAPGFLADIQLHPYQYSYYNEISGGVRGAVNQYEVDYWLTCYKELTEQINAEVENQQDVYAFLNSDLLEIYAAPNLNIIAANEKSLIPAGDLVALPLRYGLLQLYPEAPVEYSVKLDGAELCVVKKMK